MKIQRLFGTKSKHKVQRSHSMHPNCTCPLKIAGARFERDSPAPKIMKEKHTSQLIYTSCSKLLLQSNFLE